MLGFLNRFVDSNDREIKRIQPLVDEANALEAEFEALSDDEIRARFDDSATRSVRPPSPTSRPRTSSTIPSWSAAAS